MMSYVNRDIYSVVELVDIHIILVMTINSNLYYNDH